MPTSADSAGSLALREVLRVNQSVKQEHMCYRLVLRLARQNESWIPTPNLAGQVVNPFYCTPAHMTGWVLPQGTDFTDKLLFVLISILIK